jgi:hypothetical protein
LQPVGDLHPPAIDPDFTAANDAINVAFRHAFQDLVEEIVYALVVRGLVNLSPGYRSFA